MVKQATAVKTIREEMLADYYLMCERCCATGDYDPFVPLLYYIERDMDREEALWYSCLFIAHYNPGSAWIAFHDSKVLQYKKWDLPIETARRSLQGGRIYQHLDDLIDKAGKAGSLWDFFTQGFGSDPEKNWLTLNATIRSLYGHGRWGGYIFGGILRKVHGLNVRQPDLGNKGSSGPLNGLILIMNEGTDEAAARLLEMTRANTCINWAEHRCAPEPDMDYGVLESMTCDFNSMNKSRYYVGRDFDRDQYRIRRAEKATGVTLTPVWEARKAVFPNQYLGELNGWEGIDKDRLKVYQQTGEITDR